jgi:hypothetical protein
VSGSLDRRASVSRRLQPWNGWSSIGGPRTKNCARSASGTSPIGAADPLLANLETRRVVGDRAAVDDQLGVPLLHELGVRRRRDREASTVLADGLTRAG